MGRLEVGRLLPPTQPTTTEGDLWFSYIYWTAGHCYRVICMRTMRPNLRVEALNRKAFCETKKLFCVSLNVISSDKVILGEQQ
jgi:hypothetical protein